MAAAVLGEIYDGCENAPCGSPLWLLVPGAAIALVCGWICAAVVRDARRPYDPARHERHDLVYNPPRGSKPPGSPDVE
jgi:hypothetical protein